jgi:hypothetical protein
MRLGVSVKQACSKCLASINDGVNPPMSWLAPGQPGWVTSIERLQPESISQMKMQILRSSWTEMDIYDAETGVAEILWRSHLYTGWSQSWEVRLDQPIQANSSAGSLSNDIAGSSGTDMGSCSLNPPVGWRS